MAYLNNGSMSAEISFRRGLQVVGGQNESAYVRTNQPDEELSNVDRATVAVICAYSVMPGDLTMI
jgi:hypothetical protein